jgi:hypothetical protein
VGPVLIANHGMGMPSTSILLHEVTKLLAHAGAPRSEKDAKLPRSWANFRLV